jgi:hypothetical protein
MQPALNKEAIDCSKQHDAVYGNSRDTSRHFATEKVKKRQKKTRENPATQPEQQTEPKTQTNPQDRGGRQFFTR